MQYCPICQQPIQSNHPEADVYHLDCIMEETRHLRERQRQINLKRAVATPE